MSTSLRMAQLQRMADARVKLTRALSRSFTNEELNLLLDQLPDTSAQPLRTLAEAVAAAWTELPADTTPPALP